MSRIIIFSIVLLGLLIFVISLVSGDVGLGVISVIMIILPPLYLYLKGKGKEKPVLIYPESKYEPILSSSRPIKEKKKNLITLIMTIFISVVVLGFSWMWLKNSLSTPSPLSLGGVINSACIELDPRSGCKKDPSIITVLYDVDEDGIIGGVNDTLSNLLEKYGCTGDCIKRRCGCPGY